MTSTASVFVVEHLHVHQNGEEDVKMIGVYESQEAAEQAVARLVNQPGFRDWPDIIDPYHDDEESGFYIGEFPIGKDHWTEGFVTEVYPRSEHASSTDVNEKD